MPEAPIPTAIIGLGRWGRLLATAAASPGSGLRLIRAATRTPATAQDFCAGLGLTPEADLAAVLRHGDVRAVILATPHSQHADQIRAAAAAGCHVFVEKPLALTLQQATAAADACAQAGVQLAVGFNRRFLPAFQALQRKVRSGQLGRILHVEGSFCGPFGFAYSADMWRGNRAENPAGGMAAMGIHVLDAMIALQGPIRRVAVLSRRLAVENPVDDTTTVLLDFASGATGTLSTIMATAASWRLRASGSSGWAEMPDQHRLLVAPVSGDIRSLDFDPRDTLALELAAFADSIRNGSLPAVTRAEALAGVSAMTAIARSAEAEGAWMTVETTC